MDLNAVMDIYNIPQTVCTDNIEQVLTHLFRKVENKLHRSGNTTLEQLDKPFTKIGYRFKRAGESRGVPPKIHKVWVSKIWLVMILSATKSSRARYPRWSGIE